MDAATTVELVSGVSEAVIAFAALGFALLLARHEQRSRERMERRFDELLAAVNQKKAEPPASSDPA